MLQGYQLIITLESDFGGTIFKKVHSHLSAGSSVRRFTYPTEPNPTLTQPNPNPTQPNQTCGQVNLRTTEPADTWEDTQGSKKPKLGDFKLDLDDITAVQQWNWINK